MHSAGSGDGGRDDHRASLTGVMTWPSAGELREELNRFGGQASKGIRWMPWHQEAMKDVVKLR